MMEMTRHKISFLFDVKQNLGTKAYPVVATDSTLWSLVLALLRKVEELPEIHRVHGVAYTDMGVFLSVDDPRTIVK